MTIEPRRQSIVAAQPYAVLKNNVVSFGDLFRPFRAWKGFLAT